MLVCITKKDVNLFFIPHKYNSYFVNNFKINSINTNLTFAAKTQNIKKTSTCITLRFFSVCFIYLNTITRLEALFEPLVNDTKKTPTG